jgi:hypothetical protein
MSRARAFLRFLYDFVVGDDATLAVVVVVAFGITAALAHSAVAAWWVLPVIVIAALAFSVDRASRQP